MNFALSAKSEGRLLDLVCLLIGTIMLYRGITDFFLFKDNPWRTLLGLIFFGGVASIYLMHRRRRIGFWLFVFFDFSVGLVFIFLLEDIWYHHVLPHVAYAAVFVPFYKNMRWGPEPDPRDTRVPPEPRPSWIGRLTAPLLALVDRWPGLARLVERVPPLQRWINRRIIDGVTSSTPPRPLPLSLWTPGPAAVPRVADPPPTEDAFVSWTGLVDRTFTGRHLPPISEAAVAALPERARVEALFARDAFAESGKTTALFCFFAQWFTDSFLRTHPTDARKNTSNHEIDLCQIYGLGPGAAWRLREHRGGRLKAREGQPLQPGGVPPIYPDFLADPVTLEVKDEYAGISFDPILATSFEHSDPPHGFARDLREMLKRIGDWTQTDDRWRMHYAAGLERANSTIVYSAINTIFLREHNRLAGELAGHYPEMVARPDGDDRLFETARNINIVLLLKIIVEDYINHLAASPFRLRLEQGFADRCRWYRANRISLEFNLLYRWHAMVPDRFELQGKVLTDREFRFNNALLEEVGVEAVLDAAASQPAGRLKLRNTPCFLLPAEASTIALGRQFRLAGFNAYRRRWNLPSYRSIADLAEGDDELIAELTALYPDLDGVPGVERVELSVGLLAEKRKHRQVLSPLLLSMVASDAFSQALTNPLLASYVYGADAFTGFGIREIERTHSFADLVERNRTPGSRRVDATFSNRAFDGNPPG